MKRFSASPGLARTLRVAIGLLVLAFIAAALFDWNWLRRPLIAYLAEKSQREISIADLDVDVGLSLDPTIRLRGVNIQNAPWAGERPFATAGEASFTISLRSLFTGRLVVSKLVLVDADVDMQRRADGLRNWRLRKPEDRGRGRTVVRTLEAHRTTIRFSNEERALQFVASSMPAGEDALSTRIEFRGTYQGVAFSGVAWNAGVVSFRDTAETFPLRGHMVARGTRLEFDGLFSDVLDIGPFDAKVRIRGPTLAELHPFLRVKPPPSRRVDIQAQVTHAQHVYTFSQLRAKIGETDLAGDATYDRSGPRPQIRAALRSAVADLEDLRALIGMRPSGGAARAGEESEVDRGDPNAKSAMRVLSTRRLRGDRFDALDARVSLDAKKARSDAVAMLESLKISAALAQGVLTVKPLSVGFAGGRIGGEVVLDTGRDPPLARANVELQGVRVERLIPALAQSARAVAPLRGKVELTGRGHSLAGMLGDASGSVAISMDSGSLSNLADAKMGLNLGKVLSLMIRGDRDIPIHCGAVELDVRGGVAKSRLVVLDTQQTRTDGVGTVNFRNERWDLLLSPRPKKPGLLTRLASIRLDGSFRHARISLEERVALGRSDAAAPVGTGVAITCAGSRP